MTSPSVAAARRVLVIGGTVFLGRHLVAALSARGHQITLFNRGSAAPDLFAGVAAITSIQGDRNRADDLARLGEHGVRHGGWDVVVDTCGYLPRQVAASAAALRPHVSRYVFVSSVSVYADFAPAMNEDAATAALTDPASENIARDYGALKAACERAVQSSFGAQTLIVRPGLIVGPFDPTGRFTYWPLRIAAGGACVAPAPRTQPVQFIDVRDLAAFIVETIDKATVGTFHTVGPSAPGQSLSFEEFLERCRICASSVVSATRGTPVAPADPTWIAPEFLLEQGVTPWTELPLWLGGDDAMHRIDASRAVAAGLQLRSPLATIEAVLAWANAPDFQPRRSTQAANAAQIGLTAQREQALLAAWQASGKSI